MAKQAKGNGNAAEDELVTMARGLAEIVAAHNLSELIVDTKETTLTIRRGGAVPMTVAMPAAMQMPSMHRRRPRRPPRPRRRLLPTTSRTS